MFSSKSVEWPTPQDLFHRLDSEYGPFTLDVAATSDNAKCARYFTREQDGLAQEWTGRVWMNPPYGRPLALWMAKAHEAALTTAEIVVCLIPVRTDTPWWHRFAQQGEIEFLPGRLKFGGAKTNAPFASAVVVFEGVSGDPSEGVSQAVSQGGFRGPPTVTKARG